MLRLLARLERKVGRHAIENLPLFLVGGMGIAFVLSLIRPEIIAALVLIPEMVVAGQVWRLVSWIFVPTDAQPILFLIGLWFFYGIARGLEAEWGAFRLNLYYLAGMAITIATSFLARWPVTGIYLNGTLFLAYATLFPDSQILLFGIVPVRAKILAWITAGLYAYGMVSMGWPAGAGTAAAFATYLLFFGGTIVSALTRRRLEVRQAARRESLAPAPPPRAGGEAMGYRRCAICGAREEEGADIRVCSCPKCGGAPRNLCLEHARNH